MPRLFRQSRSCSSVCRATFKSLPQRTLEDPPRFGCSSCEPPLKDACWLGVSVLWCSAESEFVLQHKTSLKLQRDAQENACFLVMLQLFVVVFCKLNFYILYGSLLVPFLKYRKGAKCHVTMWKLCVFTWSLSRLWTINFHIYNMNWSCYFVIVKLSW